MPVGAYPQAGDAVVVLERTAKTQAKNVEIECLRGIAILAVFAAHLRTLTIAGAYLPAFVSGGGAGVQLFFVISGFVVARSLLKQIDAPSPPSRLRLLGAFYLRRIFRIWPMALVGIAVALRAAYAYQLFGRFGPTHFTHDIWLIATLRLNYALVHDLVHPLIIYWSLVAEEHFYLFLPLILLFVPSPSLRKILFVGMLGVTALWARPLVAFSAEDIGMRARSLLYTTHLQLDFFSAGVLTAMMAGRGPLPGIRSRPLLAALSLIAIAVIFGAGRDDMAVFTYGPPLLLVASTLVVLLAARETELLPFPGLARTALAWIGARSYSIYLLHFPVLLTVQSVGWFRHRDPSRAFTLVLLAAAITFAVVELCHRLLEKSLIRVGARLSARLLATTEIRDR